MPPPLGPVVGRALGPAQAGLGEASSVPLLRNAPSKSAGEAMPALSQRLARSTAPPVAGRREGFGLTPAAPDPSQAGRCLVANSGTLGWAGELGGRGRQSHFLPV